MWIAVLAAARYVGNENCRGWLRDVHLGLRDAPPGSAPFMQNRVVMEHEDPVEAAQAIEQLVRDRTAEKQI
jgi:hypothetical protein